MKFRSSSREVVPVVSGKVKKSRKTYFFYFFILFIYFFTIPTVLVRPRRHSAPRLAVPSRGAFVSLKKAFPV